MKPFRDRAEAGRLLAGLLGHYADVPDLLVLALPRGGVPVGFEVARQLSAAFDVFLVRKLGVPGMEELAFGAVASGGLRVLNDSVIQNLNIADPTIEEITARETQEMDRREREFRDGRHAPEVTGKPIILVDDGLATGATMRAAVQVLRKQKPERLIVAVPIGAREVCDYFKSEVDEIVCARTPQPFVAVGYGYDNFSQTTDDEVKFLLRKARSFPVKHVNTL